MLKIEQYLISRIILNFFLVFAVIFSILLFLNFSKLSNAVIFKSIPFYKIFFFSLLLMPFFLFYSIPYISLASLLISVYKLISNNEIIILKSSGLGYFFFNKIILKISIFITIFTTVLFFIFPISAGYFYKTKLSLQNQRIFQLLQSDKINNFNKNLIYFRKLDKDGNLFDIKIIKNLENQSKIITAKNGIIKVNNKNITIELNDLNIITFHENNKENKLNIQAKNAEFGINNLLDIQQDNPIEKLIKFATIKELMNEKYDDDLINKELYQRISVIIEVFVSTIICGAVLFLQHSERISGRKYYLFSILIFFAYISLNAFSESLLLSNIKLLTILSFLSLIIFFISFSSFKR